MRVSRTVLRGTSGETPEVYSPKVREEGASPHPTAKWD